jgi:type VI secretion system protein ImpH
MSAPTSSPAPLPPSPAPPPSAALTPTSPASWPRGFETLLVEEAGSVDFFQAVRLLERLRPDRAPVGGHGEPAAEVVRFGVPPVLAFPGAEIAGLVLPGDGGPARMQVTFLGLTGPTGVLPHHYTMRAAERARARDGALQDFYDLFHHRLLSLYYRAWSKYRPAIAYERGDAALDRTSTCLRELAGLAAAAGVRLPIADETLLFYLGLLLLPTRPAAALEQLLADYFDVPAVVEQFVGAWYPLAPADQSALDDDGDAPALLGAGAVVGDEVWDPQVRVRVRLGPLTRAQYEGFLPPGRAHAPLRALVRLFVGESLDVEVQLALARDEVPGCVLGAGEDAGSVPRLGWGTWIRTAPFGRDPDETLLMI